MSLIPDVLEYILCQIVRLPSIIALVEQVCRRWRDISRRRQIIDRDGPHSSIPIEAVLRYPNLLVCRPIILNPTISMPTFVSCPKAYSVLLLRTLDEVLTVMSLYPVPGTLIIKWPWSGSNYFDRNIQRAESVPQHLVTLEEGRLLFINPDYIMFSMLVLHLVKQKKTPKVRIISDKPLPPSWFVDGLLEYVENKTESENTLQETGSNVVLPFVS